MKKVLALVLALVLVLSLAACGGNGENKASSKTSDSTTETAKETKEDLLSAANTNMWTTDEIDKMGENAAYAKSLVGKVYKTDVKVLSVEQDHVKVNDFYVKNNYGSEQFYGHPNLSADIYLPKEVLADLEQSQKLTIVGKITDLTSSTQSFEGYSKKVNVLVFGTAYIVNDRYQYNGKLFGANRDYEGAYNVLIPPTAKIASLVYFRAGEDSKLNGLNSEFKFDAKVFVYEQRNEYKDAVIVE